MITDVMQIQSINIGKQGEHKAVTLEFDMSEFVSLFGSGGSAVIVHQRPGDSRPYVCQMTSYNSSESVLSWTVTSTDTAKNGTGHAEIRWVINGATAKSARFSTVVLSGVNDPTVEAPGNVVYMVTNMADYYTDEKFSEKVEEWMTAHPEATTTVQDGSITTAKLADGSITNAKLSDGAVTEGKLTGIVKSALYMPNSFHFGGTKPHAFWYNRGTTQIGGTGTIQSFQGCCEFEQGGNTYLAAGFVMTADSEGNQESGIILFKNGTIDTFVRGDYGHVNSLTYCSKNNRLYVGASSTYQPSTYCYSLDATTLESKNDLGTLRTHTIWYDEKSESFYLVQWKNSKSWICKAKYATGEETDFNNKEWLFSFDDTGLTTQTICVHNGAVMHLYWDGNNRMTTIYSHTMDGSLIGVSSSDFAYECEQLYVYKDRLYLSFNSNVATKITASGTTWLSSLNVVELCDGTDCCNLMISSLNETVYFDSGNADLYGDGSSSSKTASAAQVFMSGKKFVNITGDFLLPYCPIKRDMVFTGNNGATCTLNNMYSVSVKYENLRIIIGNTEHGNVRNSRILFQDCTIDASKMRMCNSSEYYRVFCNDVDITATNCTFTGVGKSAIFAEYSYGLGNNRAYITKPTIDAKSVTPRNYSEPIFIGFDVKLCAGTTDLKKLFFLSREFSSVRYDLVNPTAVEDGTHDLDNLIIDNVEFSFKNGLTLSNAPSGYSGRCMITTKRFGTTNGILQIFTDATGKMWTRLLTGINTGTFDNSGNLTLTPSASAWVKVGSV